MLKIAPRVGQTLCSVLPWWVLYEPILLFPVKIRITTRLNKDLLRSAMKIVCWKWNTSLFVRLTPLSQFWWRHLCASLLISSLHRVSDLLWFLLQVRNRTSVRNVAAVSRVRPISKSTSPCTAMINLISVESVIKCLPGSAHSRNTSGPTQVCFDKCFDLGVRERLNTNFPNEVFRCYLELGYPFRILFINKCFRVTNQSAF